MRQSFVLTEARFPHKLIPNGIGKRGNQYGDGTEEHIAQTRDLRMFNIDQHDADENNTGKEQAFGWNFSAEEIQHDRCGKDGSLPGGGYDPTRGEGGAERDEGIKNSEANGSGENPEAPMLKENIFDVRESFASLCDEDDHDEEYQHVPESQTRGPCPMSACKTHRAVEDEGTTKE